MSLPLLLFLSLLCKLASSSFPSLFVLESLYIIFVGSALMHLLTFQIKFRLSILSVVAQRWTTREGYTVGLVWRIKEDYLIQVGKKVHQLLGM